MSLAEVIVAMGMCVGVGAASVALVSVARVVATTQPEVADLQQRLRVAIDLVANEASAAGAGFDQTSAAGPLLRLLPPVAPYRRGQIRDDAVGGVWFRPDVLSVLSVTNAQAQASITTAVDLGGRVRLTVAPNCGPLAPTDVCGFGVGTRVILAHPSGAHDLMTVERAVGPVLELSYVGALGFTYDDGQAVVGAVDASTFSLDLGSSTGVPTLTRYDGFATTNPAVDHVVALSFEYFGMAEPPVVFDMARWPSSRSVSYGLVPPRVADDDPATSWGAGENCTFAVVGGTHVSRLSWLGRPGELVPLPAAILDDGPWCPDAGAPRKFDADLLRVRRVRIRVRTEASWAALRGWGGLVTRRGTAAYAVTSTPDHEAVIDVAPRNLLSWP